MCEIHEIRDKGLETCRIHHKRKTHDAIVTTLYTEGMNCRSLRRFEFLNNFLEGTLFLLRFSQLTASCGS